MIVSFDSWVACKRTPLQLGLCWCREPVYTVHPLVAVASRLFTAAAIVCAYNKTSCQAQQCSLAQAGSRGASMPTCTDQRRLKNQNKGMVLRLCSCRKLLRRCVAAAGLLLGGV
jgi:hypothetical protein